MSIYYFIKQWKLLYCRAERTYDFARDTFPNLFWAVRVFPSIDPAVRGLVSLVIIISFWNTSKERSFLASREGWLKFNSRICSLCITQSLLSTHPYRARVLLVVSWSKAFYYQRIYLPLANNQCDCEIYYLLHLPGTIFRLPNKWI